jgi:hypothetical protein
MAYIRLWKIANQLVGRVFSYVIEKEKKRLTRVRAH